MKTIQSKMFAKSNSRKQSGFTLIEITIALLIIAVLSYLSMPKIRAYIVEGRVEAHGRSLSEAVMRIRANAEGGGPLPYATVSTATLANTLRDRSTAMTITGIGNTAAVSHSLGATGSQVTVALVDAGAGFRINVPGVHNGACPALATQIQNTAETIAINGTTVKALGGTYSGQIAQDACTQGENNEYVFTFR